MVVSVRTNEKKFFQASSIKEVHFKYIGFVTLWWEKARLQQKIDWYSGHQFSASKAPIIIDLCNICCVSNLTVLFLFQVDQIEKVFSSSHKQRNWDHFSKAQRKNLELWFKQAQVGFLAIKQVGYQFYFKTTVLVRIRMFYLLKKRQWTLFNTRFVRHPLQSGICFNQVLYVVHCWMNQS